MTEKQETFIPHSHFPYGQDGSGFYSDHHLAVYDIQDEAISLVVSAVQSPNIKPGSTFTVVDYGTADGGTSMPLMYACVKAIREKYGNELPINIIYEDQPINDFKSLFMRLQGLIPGPPSYLKDFHNVFVLASGTNFYEQCLPSNSVNLGFAASSFHWLSKLPYEFSDTIVYFLSDDCQGTKKHIKQGEQDWELILLKRAAELAPGGKLIVAVHIMLDEYLGKPYEKISINIFKLLSALWKDLVNEGAITKEEFKATNFAGCTRSVDDLKKPFECPDSPVRQAGLELVSLETKIIPCVLYKKYLEHKDPKKYAKELTQSTRTWGNSAFTSGLSSSRSNEEKTRIVDEFFRRYEAEVEKHPGRYQYEWPFAYIQIQKRSDF